MIIFLIVGLIKKMLLNNILLNKVLLNPLYKMSQYFPKLYDRLNENVKVKLDLSNQTNKVDLKGATGAGTSNLAAKLDLVILKAEV